MAVLVGLPGIPGSTTAELLLEEMKWLSDDAMYEMRGVPLRSSRGAPVANYKEEWMKRLLQVGIICKIPDSEVRGWTRMYAIPEPAKERFRSIMHTEEINDNCEVTSNATFPTKIDIASVVHAGPKMLYVDFSAYYYQFQLSEMVGRRMCFSWNNNMYRLCRLPMGQRQAVGIANAATQRLLDFPKQSKRTMSIIDNVIFTGETDDIVEDAWTFVQRCKAVNATLNEVDVRTATREQVAELVREEGDWGGIHINLVDKTVCLTQKAVDKTRVSWENRDAWEWRHYAAHVGLLFWAWQIIELPMAEFFKVLRFNSEVSKMAMQRLAEERTARGLPDDAMPPNPFWNEQARLWPSMLGELERWTRLVITNAPRKVPPPDPPEVLIECDASRWGWGCRGVHLASNNTFAHGEAWSEEMERRFADKLGASTFAEPFGVLYSLMHARDLFPDATRFGVTNDNTVAVASHTRGFNSRSWGINESLRQRNVLLPEQRFSVEIKHVPGTSNIADGVSRGATAYELQGVDQVLRSRWGTSNEVT